MDPPFKQPNMNYLNFGAFGSFPNVWTIVYLIEFIYCPGVDDKS